MKRIKLTVPEIIAAFFGDAAQNYDFVITQDDFDRDDNWGPGRYCGIEVPDDLAACWDAGIAACGTQGIGNRTAEGYALRLQLMYPDATAQELSEMLKPVEEYRVRLERELAERKEAKERPQREYAAALAKIAELTAGLTGTGYGPCVTFMPETGTRVIRHHQFCHTVDPDMEPDTEILTEPLVTVMSGYVNDWGQDTIGILYRTRNGFVQWGNKSSDRHYVSAELATEYRVHWARLNGVTRQSAEVSVGSPYIQNDQREMYRAVLALLA